MLGARGPDLLAVDDVGIVALAPRRRLQRRRVGAGARLGDAEGLEAQAPGGDLGQVLLLLLRRAVAEHRAHRVHLGVASGAVAAGALHLLEDRGGRRQRQPRVALYFQDQHREVAGLGERVHELAWVAVLAIELAPVFARELRAQPDHRLADLGVVAALEGLSHLDSTCVLPRIRPRSLHVEALHACASEHDHRASFYPGHPGRSPRVRAFGRPKGKLRGEPGSRATRRRHGSRIPACRGFRDDPRKERETRVDAQWGTVLWLARTWTPK